jgi:hypothetical protein
MNDSCGKFHELASLIVYDGSLDNLYAALIDACLSTIGRANLRAIEGISFAYIESKCGLRGSELQCAFKGFVQYILEHSSDFGTYRVISVEDGPVYLEPQLQCSFSFAA